MPTRPFATAFACALLVLPLLQATQDQQPDSKSTQDTEASAEAKPASAWQLAEEWQGLIGTWQMMDFQHVTEVLAPNGIRGYVSFQEGFMEIIVHALGGDLDDEQLGQAGFYRWQVNAEGVLQTATLMGHSNFGDEFEWEPTNVPREFRIELDKDDLILTRPDLSQLIFRRMRPSEFPKSALERIKELRAELDE